jgi:hypothetical protein
MVEAVGICQVMWFVMLESAVGCVPCSHGARGVVVPLLA